jgi:hypothetical protein
MEVMSVLLVCDPVTVPKLLTRFYLIRCGRLKQSVKTVQFQPYELFTVKPTLRNVTGGSTGCKSVEKNAVGNFVCCVTDHV